MIDRIVIAFGPEVLVLTADEFAQARERGRAMVAPPIAAPTAPAASLVDADALEKATGVPARWWMDQARVHRVPHRRIGRFVRFDLTEVMACDAVRRRGVNGSAIRGGAASD